MGAPVRLKDRVPRPKRIGAHSWLGRAEGDVEITRTATFIFENGTTRRLLPGERL